MNVWPVKLSKTTPPLVASASVHFKVVDMLLFIDRSPFTPIVFILPFCGWGFWSLLNNVVLNVLSSFAIILQ